MFISIIFVTYLFFYFIRLHEYFAASYNTGILSILLASSLLLYVFKPDKNLNTIVLPYMLGFFIWAILSHVSFGYLAGTIETADTLYKLLILYLISAALFVDMRRLEFYMKFIALCAFVMALHGIDQFHGDGTGWTGRKLLQGRIRYLGGFGDPNDLGMLFCIAIPIYFYFLNKSRFILIRILWLMGVTVLLYGIYLTHSRGTLLSLLALIGFYGWHKYSRAVVISVAVIAFPMAYALTRLSTISSSEASARGRIDAWAEGFFMLRSDPFFGVGHGLFTDYHHLVAHSSYVQTFAEIGLIGYFFWVGMFAVPIYLLYKFVYKFKLTEDSKTDISEISLLAHKKIATTVLYALLAYALCAFFISRSTQPLLFLMCGMSAGMITMLASAIPGFETPRFRDTFKINSFVVISSIMLIYISIKVFW